MEQTKWGSLKQNDELNAIYLFALEPGIVGDEKVNASAGGAGKLNASGGRRARSERSVNPRRFCVEGKD